MKERLLFYIGRIKDGRLTEMWKQTKWIYHFGKKYWPAMVMYTVLGLVGTLIALFSSWISKQLVDIITGQETGKLVATFSIMLGINLATTVLNMISGYASNWISLKVDTEIKSQMFSKILVTDWESLTNYHTGDLLTRWNADASSISSGILHFVPNLCIYSFRFISALVMVLYHDVTFALLALLGMPVSFLLSRTLTGRMVNNNKKSAAMSAKMSGFNQETFANIQTIKAFDLIPLYVNRLKGLQKEYIGMRLEFQRMSIWTSLALSLVGMLVSYASYGWGIYRVWSGAISYGTMTMFLGLSGTLTGALNNLTSLIPSAIAITTSAGRLMDIVEMPQEDYSQKDEVKAFAERNEDKGISLCMENVKYAYQSGKEVFTNATMEAHPHEIVALVGPSGEGKTTMLRLLLSLMRTQDGEACLCGGNAGLHDESVDKISMTPATRCVFSYVPQGNTMFSGTIAENMRNVKPDATDEEIIEVLKLACAWEFVEKLPNGINTAIKERGGGLSEGQAQRLSIARSLIRKSPILLMDEATSALDVATERKVLRNIMKDEYPRTCIVTTHRPTVLNICNRVYAIRNQQCVVLNEEEIEDMIHNF